MARDDRPSRAWYLVPLMFGVLGGIVGYIAVRNDDLKMANKLLVLGFVISAIPFFIMLLVGFRAVFMVGA